MGLDLSQVRFEVEETVESAPFWDALRHGSFVLPRCRSCHGWFWYPRLVCPTCGSRDVGWSEASGRGVVYSHCVHHRQALPHLRDLLPVTTALVTMSEGPRLLGLLDGPPTIGLPVRIDRRTTATGLVVHVFIPDGNEPSTTARGVRR